MNPDPHAVAEALTDDVNALLFATAHAQVVREEVDALGSKLLADCVFSDEDTGERITEPRRAWLMSEESHKYYCELMAAEYVKAGYDVPDGYCPALIAEREQTEAEWALISKAEQFFGVTNDQLLRGTKDRDGLATYRRYLDLLCGLVVNRPKRAA